MSSATNQPSPVEPAAAPPAERPLAELLRLALPTVVTMTSYTVMQAVDKLMCSRIGGDTVYVGAQGNGGLAAFVPISFVMALLMVVNTYVSQNLGADSPRRAPAYAWSALWIAFLAWVLMIPYGFFLPDLFAALGHEPQRIELQTLYARPLIYGAFLTIATRGLSQFFYGMHRPGVVLLAGLVANITNFALNSVLVYGPSAPPASGFAPLDAWFGAAAWIARALGIARMGIEGSAIGTVIATAVELAIPLAIFLSPKYHRLYGTRSPWRLSLPHLRDIWRIGWPGAVMFGSEMVCWAIFMVALVGRFGPENSTAGWIAHQWMSLSFMPAVGISVAVTATVGRRMGMRRPDLAARPAWLGMGLAAAYMGAMALLFIIFRRPMIALFIDPRTPPEEVAVLLDLGGKFLIACAAFQLFDAVAMTLSGALRGAGDTVWVGVVTVGLSWGVIVGGGLALVAYAPGLGALGPWIAAAAYIFLLSLAVLWRFLGGRWKKIRLLDSAAT